MNDFPAGRVAPRLSRWAAPAFVALLTLAVFWPALHNGFLNWDDEANILTNPHYRGLGWANLRWMFTTLLGGHYQPLVWLTFAADYLVWGMNPFGYHLTNVLLHSANAALFCALASWFMARSAAPDGISPRFLAGLAALLFVVHPLRVESVAWVTERKDVLSGFFCLWAVHAYLKWHSDGSRSRAAWQGLCWGAFMMALLSKSMVMTLPVVFIILDFYPLRRLPREAGRWFSVDCRWVWLEKLPFLIPAFLIALVEYAGEQRLGSIFVENISAHCARVLFGLTFYLWKTIWPVHLCPLYESPVPFDAFAWPFLVSAVVAICLIAGLFLSYRRWPAVLTAWICYAVTVAPVLGFVSFGSQLAADRYSYLACLPWPILAASGLDWAWRRAKAWGRIIICLGTGLAITGLALSTWRQIGIWRDSETLWRYELSFHPDCAFARNNLGSALVGKGNLSESAEHVRQALRINPDYAEAHNNMGLVLAGEGKIEEAVAHYREALRLKPDMAGSHNNWGLALARQGRTEEAVAHYREALRLEPDLAVVHNDLGAALARLGRAEESAAQYREAVRLKPDYSEAHSNLGLALAEQGSAGEAIAQYREALRLKPDMAGVHNNLGLLLAGQGQAAEAVAQYREALRLKPDYLEAHYNLGLLLAGQGESDEARREFQEALRINPGFEPARKNLDVLMRH